MKSSKNLEKEAWGEDARERLDRLKSKAPKTSASLSLKKDIKQSGDSKKDRIYFET